MGAGAQQKTIVAGMAPPIMGGQFMQQPGMQQPGMQHPGMMQPGMQPGMMQPGMQPMGGMQPIGMPPGYPQAPPGNSGPNKTVMLQPSDGVISVARTPAQAVQPAGTTGMVEQGASTLFWIVSLVIGIALGVLGYVIVLQLG